MLAGGALEVFNLMNACPFSKKTQAVVMAAAKQVGSYDPGDIVDTVGRLLSRKDITFLIPFLTWVCKENKKLGPTKFAKVYEQFREQGRKSLPASELPHILKDETKHAKRLRSKRNDQTAQSPVQR